MPLLIHRDPALMKQPVQRNADVVDRDPRYHGNPARISAEPFVRRDVQDQRTVFFNAHFGDLARGETELMAEAAE